MQDVGTGDNPRGSLEAALHWKVLLLVAVVLQRRAKRWLSRLPPPLRDGAPRGALCLLFWPPPGKALATGSARADSGSLMARAVRLLEGIVAAMQTQAVTVADMFGQVRTPSVPGALPLRSKQCKDHTNL